MKKSRLIVVASFLLIAFTACAPKAQTEQVITPEQLKDKIAGAWAGKMIGVTYGAPTEFRSLTTTFEDSINWTPSKIKESVWQDDIYVQLTFLMAMDKHGIDVSTKELQKMLAEAGYMLWCANMQARKNYHDSIFPPASGHPDFNFRADDIDFQIESDYIGMLNPGMLQSTIELSDRIGHIMNYGDGVYGGTFVAALYSAAFFENDIAKVVDKALSTIPAESNYARIISDVIKLHKQYPNDWRAAWAELEPKWGDADIVAANDPGNIDATINGAYIVFGLLYGEGDPMKTIDISTRCGKDSDCNPSNAMGVLGVIKGFSNLPAEMQKGVQEAADSLFVHTTYSFNTAVDRTYKYALEFVTKNGGTVTDTEITIPVQQVTPMPLEVSFPNVVFDKRLPVFSKEDWKTKGNWQVDKYRDGRDRSLFASKAGDEIVLTFDGTGIAVMGSWMADGGKADVYLDGKLHRTIDTYYNYSNQTFDQVHIWHVFGLAPGQHTLKIVVKGEKNPASTGTRIYVVNATIYQTGTKPCETYKFSFEQ